MAELLNKTEFAHLEDGRVYRVSRNAWSRSLEPSRFAKIVTWVVFGGGISLLPIPDLLVDYFFH